jgi:hypothetical protein
MGNLMDSMKKAQEIAKQAEVVNKELMETVVIGNGKIPNPNPNPNVTVILWTVQRS